MVALFFRMGVTMVITLYSVRLLLEILGVENYGIYTVVAGFVSMLNFLSQSMAIAVQRFYSFALGKGDEKELNHIFSISFLIFLSLAVLIIIVGETLGLWFVTTQLVIPTKSYQAVIWVYHFSIFTFAISMLRIPFSSILFAYEDMKLFAIINVIESVLKLFAIISLPLFGKDHLFFYGILLLVVAILSFLINFIVTTRKYPNSRFKYYYDKSLLKSMSSFSGWSLFGTLAGIVDNQGNNVIINIFFGPVVNAARDVSLQVQTAILSFSNSVYMAFKPQMIKSYAENNLKYMMQLFYFGTKSIFFLHILICFPLFLNTKELLNLWLVKVTDNMVIFTRLSLIFSTIFALNNPISTIVQATGRIRKYFIIVESVVFLSLPISYLLFYLGLPAQSTFWVSIGIFTLAHYVRLVILKKMIQFSINEYFIKTILPMFGTIITAGGLIFLTYKVLEISSLSRFFKLGAETVSCFLFTLLAGYIVGLGNFEKKAIGKMLKNYFNK